MLAVPGGEKAHRGKIASRYGTPVSIVQYDLAVIALCFKCLAQRSGHPLFEIFANDELPNLRPASVIAPEVSCAGHVLNNILSVIKSAIAACTKYGRDPLFSPAQSPGRSKQI